MVGWLDELDGLAGEPDELDGCQVKWFDGLMVFQVMG